jgi:hypothetical protein
MSASSTRNISLPTYSEILDETLELLGLYRNASSNLERLRILLRTHFGEDIKGMNFRSFCCFGREGEIVSLELFNRLCILPKTGWGIQLSDQGSSIVPSALTPEETHQYTSQFATTVGDILRDILLGVINSHSMKETIILCIPIRGGIPFSWFQSIIGPEYKDSHFTLAPLTTLRDRISRCLDHALQDLLTYHTFFFFGKWCILERSRGAFRSETILFAVLF